jgi:hypothetical protein
MGEEISKGIRDSNQHDLEYQPYCIDSITDLSLRQYSLGTLYGSIGGLRADPVRPLPHHVKFFDPRRQHETARAAASKRGVLE